MSEEVDHELINAKRQRKEDVPHRPGVLGQQVGGLVHSPCPSAFERGAAVYLMLWHTRRALRRCRALRLVLPYRCLPTPQVLVRTKALLPDTAKAHGLPAWVGARVVQKEETRILLKPDPAPGVHLPSDTSSRWVAFGTADEPVVRCLEASETEDASRFEPGCLVDMECASAESGWRPAKANLSPPA